LTPLGLFCATANPHKLGEFRQAAGEGLLIQGLPPCDCFEEGATFEENAVSKALCYSRHNRSPELEKQEKGGTEKGGTEPLMKGGPEKAGPAPLVFADDSGLVVDALGGRPGIYSARFAGPNAGDEENNALLLNQLRGVPREQRTARFVCCIALVRGSVLLKTFEGEAEGLILDGPAGSGGFGYDPLFLFPPLGKGFAEISAETKWQHSHRGAAFRHMLDWLTKLFQSPERQ
jgi:non-canonical purine NTP pyrophosphatase (RdgB/HAM1 family)